MQLASRRKTMLETMGFNTFTKSHLNFSKKRAKNQAESRHPYVLDFCPVLARFGCQTCPKIVPKRVPESAQRVPKWTSEECSNSSSSITNSSHSTRPCSNNTTSSRRSANQRPGFKSRDLNQPIRGQKFATH